MWTRWSRERLRLRPTRGLPSARSPLGAETQTAPPFRAVACWPSASVSASGLRCAPSGHVLWAGRAGASWGRRVCACGPVRARAWSGGVSFGRPDSSEAKGAGSRSCYSGVQAPRDVSCPALALDAAGRRHSLSRADPQATLGPGQQRKQVQACHLFVVFIISDLAF